MNDLPKIKADSKDKEKRHRLSGHMPREVSITDISIV